MISKWNTRVTITLPKKLVKELKFIASRNGYNFSKMLSTIITNSRLPAPKNDISERELQRNIRIAKTPWLDDDD